MVVCERKKTTLVHITEECSQAVLTAATYVHILYNMLSHYNDVYII